MKRLIIGLVVFSITFSLVATVRVVTYNALNFGGNDLDRLPYFETILYP